MRAYLLVLLLFPAVAFAQETDALLTQEKVLWLVQKFHPIAKQAALLNQKGESNLRRAKGGFDPYLHGNFDQKHYNDKNYFSLFNGGLKVPTWYGIELKTGFDQNSGVFLNPENAVPENGLWYAGVSVSLGQGLFIDQRRTELEKARIFAKSSLVEQQKILNDLYFEALQTYWKWAETWNQMKIYEESLELASVRFNAVKQSFLFGDVPAIDTLEAFLQVQNRQMNLSQSRLDYQKAALYLSNFLWFEKNTPLELSDSVKAPWFKSMNIKAVVPQNKVVRVLEQLASTHPEMQLVEYKLNSLEIDRRLKSEKLKPKVNLNYNALSASTTGNNEQLLDNYKWGVEVSFPVFLRKQRGELQLNRLKINDATLGQQQKLLELQNKVKAYHIEQQNLEGQVQLFTVAVENYQQLWKGEKQKFESGESSLFLVNSRELYLIEAQLKLVALLAKYNIAHSGFDWATGNGFEVL